MNSGLRGGTPGREDIFVTSSSSSNRLLISPLSSDDSGIRSPFSRRRACHLCQWTSRSSRPGEERPTDGPLFV